MKLCRASLGWGCAEGLGELWLILTQCCVDRPWKVSVEPGRGKPEVKGPGPRAQPSSVGLRTCFLSR